MNSDTLFIITMQLATTGLILKDTYLFLLSGLLVVFLTIYVLFERNEQRKINEQIKKYKIRNEE
jgi:hypothetical protein